MDREEKADCYETASDHFAAAARDLRNEQDVQAKLHLEEARDAIEEATDLRDDRTEE